MFFASFCNGQVRHQQRKGKYTSVGVVGAIAGYDIHRNIIHHVIRKLQTENKTLK